MNKSQIKISIYSDSSLAAAETAPVTVTAPVVDTEDSILMNVPLFMRCLEYSYESIKNDEQLHKFVERIIEHSNKNGPNTALTMADYQNFIK